MNIERECLNCKASPDNLEDDVAGDYGSIIRCHVCGWGFEPWIDNPGYILTHEFIEAYNSGTNKTKAKQQKERDE